MTLGTLVHSEIWNNLRQLGIHKEDRYEYFRIVNAVDGIFREHAEKAKDRKVNRPESSEGIRTAVEQRKAEMERGSKAV